VFARPTEAPDPEVPRGQLVKAAARRTAMLAEARDVLAVLPGPGEALHALMTGRYDLLALIMVLLEKWGRCETLRIATLSYNGRNVAELLNQLDAGTIGRLTVLCSLFFRAHNPSQWTQLRDGLVERDSDHRLAAARSHAKVVCLAFPDGRHLVLEGSANLRTNSNQEQFCLIEDAGLHDWHALWIDAMVAKHEGDQSGNGETG
jgi:hypothetical protein